MARTVFHWDQERRLYLTADGRTMAEAGVRPPKPRRQKRWQLGGVFVGPFYLRRKR